MEQELRVLDDAAAVARAGAAYVADLAGRAVADHGDFTLAVSGGHTPRQMFEELAHLDVPWSHTTVFQVDERVAPPDDPDRNLLHLRAALEGVAVRVVAMPVEAADLDVAAGRYAAQLPERFDLVHLGIGPDGHTASLVPGDPVLDVDDRAVAVTGHQYQGRRRMTLTYPGLARAEQLLWLVVGGTKAAPLRKLLEGSAAIPAGRVVARSSLVMADRAAVPGVGSGAAAE